jgi:hypothetical protein
MGDIMWILPKQLHTLASVLDTEESEKDLENFCQHCETSLMWRSKPSQSQTWLRRWKANKWMKHLSIRMLRPSHTKYFVDAWTSLVVDSHVNRFLPQELDKELKTLVTSTPTLAEESKNVDQELFSSKMLKELSQAKQETDNQFSNMSSQTWKEWVIDQRQEYSQRAKLAHLTREKESLSWATPNTMDTLPARNPEALAKAKKKGGCKNLREEVINFPTPRTADAEGGTVQAKISETGQFYRENKKGEKWSVKLKDAVETWPTPTTAEAGKIGNQPNYGQVGLSNHPTIVGKPTRTKSIKDGKAWATPMSRDYKDSPNDKGGRDITLPRQMHSQVDQTKNNMNGNNLVLNPSWVEQLMGLPVEWTDLGSWGTE